MTRRVEGSFDIDARDAVEQEFQQHRGPRTKLPSIHYPVLSDRQLAARWNLSTTTLQRWCSEGIGPPSWRIGRQARYLESEVEAFECKAQVTWKSVASRVLSEPSPMTRQDAIEWSAKFWPPARKRILLDVNEVSSITGLPAYWLAYPDERARLGVPHYVLAGTPIRFNIEEIFRWEVAHLLPRRGGKSSDGT